MDLSAAARHVERRYGIVPTRIERLSASDTAVFRVHEDGRCHVLRVHGAHQPEEVASLMRWLAALEQDGVPAPAPRRTLDGAWVAEHATLVRWVEGRRRRAAPRPVHLARLGRLMARLHEHAAGWAPPASFRRPTWDAAEVYCERGIAAPPDGDPWRLVPREHVAGLRRACETARPYLDDPDRLLIHADLHLANVVFADGEARPIDFDDTGIGPVGYDVASALAPYRLEATWSSLREAFCRGYATVRPLPDLTTLDHHIVGRLAGLALWCASMAQTHPAWQEHLDAWVGGYARRLARLLEALSIAGPRDPSGS